jgi:hypothetical protein
MKTKMQADFEAVEAHMREHGTSKTEAIVAVAAESGRSKNTVMASYYRFYRLQKGTTAAPPKKKTTRKIKTTQGSGSDLELNVVRASLNNALKIIDKLEAENEKNQKIVSNLRSLVA